MKFKIQKNSRNIIQGLGVLLIIFVVFLQISGVNALTPKEEKGVKTLKADSIAWQSPEWFTPFPLQEAPEEAKYWVDLIPYTGADQYDTYIVMPTLGLVAPVIEIEKGTEDYNQMTQGQKIDIDSYLRNGVLHYPGTGQPGAEANPVIFGHSNFYKNGKGNYKTIFADIMNLDATYTDEIWIYERVDEESPQKSLSTGEAGSGFVLLKFAIEESYETEPTDVDIIQPQGGKEMTVFACTNGLEGRRILKTRLIESNEILVPYDMKFRFLDTIKKMRELPKSRQEEIREIMLNEIDTIRSGVGKDFLGEESGGTKLRSGKDLTYEEKFKIYLLNYFQRTLEESQ